MHRILTAVGNSVGTRVGLSDGLCGVCGGVHASSGEGIETHERGGEGKGMCGGKGG